MRGAVALLASAFTVACAGAAWPSVITLHAPLIAAAVFVATPTPSAVAVATAAPVESATATAAPAPATSAAPVAATTPVAAATRGPVLSLREQALAGTKVFSAHCASCHGAQLEGGAGPALDGPDFAASIAQDRLNLGDVFGMVAYQMPYDAPGSLSHADYEAVVAFLLARNGQALTAPAILYDSALKSKAPFLVPGP